MHNSRFDLQQLQQRDPRVWSSLLSAGLKDSSILVRAVQGKAINETLHRFTVQLDGHSDPITLLGKTTNEIEARFFQQVAVQLPFVTARIWYAYVGGDESWIVCEDIPNHHPAELWGPSDIEAVVGELAFLHALFWQKQQHLANFGWLPHHLGTPSAPTSAPPSAPAPTLPAARLSGHALSTAGSLAPQLAAAAEGLHKLMAIGGWPDVIDERHMEAAADLLDDPLPMLRPLRVLPQTLLHGFPGVYNWRTTLFNDWRLIDWKTVGIGSPLSDLIVFTESLASLKQPDGGWLTRESWREIEAFTVDTYMMQMVQDLGRGFNARLHRQALPAARCLYVLTHWFPRFNLWFNQLPTARDERVWQQLTRLDDEELAQTIYKPLAMRRFLGGVFQRFLNAYYQIS